MIDPTTDRPRFSFSNYLLADSIDRRAELDFFWKRAMRNANPEDSDSEEAEYALDDLAGGSVSSSEDELGDTRTEERIRRRQLAEEECDEAQVQ